MRLTSMPLSFGPRTFALCKVLEVLRAEQGLLRERLQLLDCNSPQNDAYALELGCCSSSPSLPLSDVRGDEGAAAAVRLLSESVSRLPEVPGPRLVLRFLLLSCGMLVKGFLRQAVRTGERRSALHSELHCSGCASHRVTLLPAARAHTSRSCLVMPQPCSMEVQVGS